jgi:Putative 8-oxoguanine DNA glycosylase OGG-like protein
MTPQAAPPAASSRWRALLPTLLDLVIPTAGYFLLHWAGLSDVWALTIAGSATGVNALVHTIRRGRLDVLGLLVVAEIAVSVVLVVVTADPRLILVRPAVYLAVAGLVNLVSWLATFPESTQPLASLPVHLDRATVRAACLDAPRSPAAARHAFLVVMAWGYGTVGYGPWRTARILQESSRAPDRLAKVAQHLTHRGALDAYGLLGGGCRLRGLGPAFGTKYLSFCPQSAAGPQALILDRLVADWLAEYVDVRLDPISWAPRTYRRYLELVSSWADAIGVKCEEIEWCIFAGVPQLAGTWPCLICSELRECLDVGVRPCAHELMFSPVSASCAHPATELERPTQSELTI